MNPRLVLIVCLVGGCNRERTTTPTASLPSVSAVSRKATDAGTRPVAPGSSSAVSSVPHGKTFSAVASGYTSGLRLETDALTYCDNRGGRALDLASGVENGRERVCEKHEERNSGCGGIDFIESVREPDQDDIIDAKVGPSFPVHGHIHDCAFSSGVLLVATGLEVVAIDVKTDRREIKSKDGGDQVAINDEWLAWSDGEKVFAQRR